MSDDIYHNVLNTEIQGTDRMEMMVAIYESGDDLRTQTDTNTNRQQPLQSTGSERVMKRSYRSVTVCLVLLCVLLLTAVIVLCVLINTNNHQFNIRNKNITEERDQLLTKYTNITEERDELITKCNYISKLSEQWIQKINGLLTDGWINYKFSFYFISSEKKNWIESRRYCREKEADLIIINNKEEQDLFKNRSEADSIWIGLTDSDEEGKWKWVDGSTLTTSFWDTVIHKEPNGKTKENCVVSYTPGWADFSCTKTFKWICRTLHSSAGHPDINHTRATSRNINSNSSKMAKNTSGDRNYSGMKRIKKGDAEEKNIYANTDNINIHNLCGGTEETTRNQTSQHTDIETVRLKMKCYRSVTVCLVLLCVLLLTAVTVLCVLINTNNHQFNIKNKNLTEERDQLLTKYTDITEERDQLITNNTNLTEERDKLIAKCNYISKLSEEWNQKINGLLTDGWINYKFSLYFISSEKKSWSESRRYCRERGADLIIINNKEEQVSERCVYVCVCGGCISTTICSCLFFSY
ncbi:uncharacterized protein [Paramisgurnus dabryanus]|uniref:uncharacterized protein n=1 Tax=Paramisgurnus dabryanus TaxID=90735 RepID=UPI003CCF434C